MKRPNIGMKESLKEQFKLKPELSEKGLRNLLNHKIKKFQGDVEFLKKVLLNETELAALEGNDDVIERNATLWHMIKTGQYDKA